MAGLIVALEIAMDAAVEGSEGGRGEPGQPETWAWGEGHLCG